MFADADFAGDRSEAKSTSGCLIAIVGPHSFYPLSALSKKQSAVACSTPEAEIVAAYEALRTEAMPLLDLFEVVLGGRKVDCTLYEDNQAAIKIMESGKFPK